VSVARSGEMHQALTLDYALGCRLRED